MCHTGWIYISAAGTTYETDKINRGHGHCIGHRMSLLPNKECC